MAHSYLAKAQGEILMAILTLADVTLGQELVEMLGGHLFSHCQSSLRVTGMEAILTSL